MRNDIEAMTVEGAAAVNVWVEAARPRTLPASAAPVLVGTAAGAMHGGLVWWRFLLALVVALAVQVSVNYAKLSELLGTFKDDYRNPNWVKVFRFN